MNIGYISDLHTECNKFGVNFSHPLDILIICGDVGQKSYLVKQVIVDILKKLPEHAQIIYVLGNHEYVYQVFDEVLMSYRNEFKELKRVIILEKESVVINGVKFIGTTLWSGFNNKNNETVEKINRKIMDYGIKIRNPDSNNENYLLNFDHEFIYDEFIKCKKFLEDELSKKHSGRVIVITHYPPHQNSKNPNFLNDVASDYYCNHLPELFNLERVDFWIHGHTHYSADYQINKTNVLSNPRGRTRKGILENDSFNMSNYIEMQ